MRGMKKATKITAQERDLIAVLYSKGLTKRQIAKRLGRHHTSIVREINRNSFIGKSGKYYVAIHAQAKAKNRTVDARKRHQLKNPAVYSYVLEKLRWGWSPEQIVGRLKRDNNGQTIICHETIYRFIYSTENKDKRLWEYLPWKRTKRRKKHDRLVQRCRIPNRVSIHDRPALINQRLQFGHWEGDSVIGRRKTGRIIHTQVERKTRYLKANLVGSLAAAATALTQLSLFINLPPKARRSTTLDNGLEFADHEVLKQTLNLNTYFADPYCSCQRGTNEYHNGLLRRYLPKGMDFNQLNQPELDEIVNEINSKPKKVLQYKTANEAFTEELGGAIQSRM